MTMSDQSRRRALPRMELFPMLSVADSPARTSALQDEVPASKANDLASGIKCSASSRKRGPDTSSLKTSPSFDLADWIPACGGSLKSGMMRSGILYRLPTLAHPTSASGHGSWPTLRREDGESTGMSAARMATRQPDNLPTAVRAWPTPCARDHMPAHSLEYIAAKVAQGHGMANLNDVVAHHGKEWPTPAARDYRAPNNPDGASRLSRPPTSGEQSPNAVGGVLNPEWVELLMGFPVGHTAVAALNPGRAQPRAR